jgi:hypothetical protein
MNQKLQRAGAGIEEVNARAQRDNEKRIGSETDAADRRRHGERQHFQGPGIQGEDRGRKDIDEPDYAAPLVPNRALADSQVEIDQSLEFVPAARRHVFLHSFRSRVRRMSFRSTSRRELLIFDISKRQSLSTLNPRLREIAL